MKIMRKFSVRLNATFCGGIDDLSPDKSYPVLMIEKSPKGETLVMIASDDGRFLWFDIDNEEVFLSSIDE